MTPMDWKKNEIKIYQGKKEKIEKYKQNSINRMNNVNLKYDNEIAKLQEDINEAIKFKEKVIKEYKRNKIIYGVASVLLLNPLPLLMLKPTKRKLEYAIKSLEEKEKNNNDFTIYKINEKRKKEIQDCKDDIKIWDGYLNEINYIISTKEIELKKVTHDYNKKIEKETNGKVVSITKKLHR